MITRNTSPSSDDTIPSSEITKRAFDPSFRKQVSEPRFTAAQIKGLREEHSLSLGDLAKVIGIPEEQIAKFESNRDSPSTSTMKLFNFLNAHPQFIKILLDETDGMLTPQKIEELHKAHNLSAAEDPCVLGDWRSLEFRNGLRRLPNAPNLD